MYLLKVLTTKKAKIELIELQDLAEVWLGHNKVAIVEQAQTSTEQLHPPVEYDMPVSSIDEILDTLLSEVNEEKNGIFRVFAFDGYIYAHTSALKEAISLAKDIKEVKEEEINAVVDELHEAQIADCIKKYEYIDIQQKKSRGRLYLAMNQVALCVEYPNAEFIKEIKEI